MGIWGFLLSALGVLLLLPTLAGVALGIYMASGRRTRGQGMLFALWWMPAAAAAVGMIMHDPVTFLVGIFCFVVAGAALAIERGAGRKPGGRGGKRGAGDDETSGSLSRLSERTTQRRIRTTNRKRREAAS